jgi:ParB family transcriptional regulator, chromosome partitioning protein
MMNTIELKGLQGLNRLLQADNEITKDERFFKVSINNLIPSIYQPHKNIKEADLTELMQSIKSQGIIQPIIVREAGNNKFEIVAGERRWRAAKLAELNEIPVICRELNDQTVIAFALIENIQRQALNIIDEAISFKQLIEEFSLSQEELARMLGKARPTISNTLRLLNLHSEVRTMLSNELLDVGHAKILLSLKEENQVKAANIIIERNLTVRDAEKLIKLLNRSPDMDIPTQNVQIDDRIYEWEKTLSKKLHSKVKINWGNNGKGRVVINIESVNELEWLIKNLNFKDDVS